MPLQRFTSNQTLYADNDPSGYQTLNNVVDAVNSFNGDLAVITGVGDGSNATVAAAPGTTSRTLSAWLGDVANVLTYGADATGVANSTTAIQTAINTGKPVFLPAGTYKVTSALTSNKQAPIFGAGRGLTILNVVGSGYDVLTFSASYAGVSDLTFTSSVARTAGAYVQFSATTRENWVRDCNLQKWFVGIQVTGNAVAMLITGNELLIGAASTGVGIDLANGNDFYISKCLIDHGGTLPQPLAGVRFRASALWMSDCDVIRSGIGLLVDPDGTQPQTNIRWGFFSSVAFDTCTNAGIKFAPTGGASTNGFFFSNSWSSTNLMGVQVVRGTGHIDGLYFNACSIFNNQQYGAYINLAFNVEFDGCRVSGNSASSSGTYPGIKYEDTTTNFAVRNCGLGQNTGQPASQSYGLVTGVNCLSYIIANNTVTGNVTGGVLETSASTITACVVGGNRGYQTVNCGTANMLIATTTVVVTHGLDVAPHLREIMLSLASTPQGIGGFWVSAVTATDFTITTSVAPASGVLINWSARARNG